MICFILVSLSQSLSLSLSQFAYVNWAKNRWRKAFIHTQTQEEAASEDVFCVAIKQALPSRAFDELRAAYLYILWGSTRAMYTHPLPQANAKAHNPNCVENVGFSLFRLGLYGIKACVFSKSIDNTRSLFFLSLHHIRNTINGCVCSVCMVVVCIRICR